MSRPRLAFVLLVPALAFALFAAACHRAPAGPQTWKLTLTTEPPVPLPLHTTRFHLHVTDARGHALTGAAASLSLEMTFMDMGPNVVQLSDNGKGDYSGDGQFTDTGEWDIHAKVTRGADQRTQVFHYKIGG